MTTHPSVRVLAASVRANVPVILWGNPGVGKALALDTPIPTPDGWTTMGDLEVGDRVFSELGQPCTVTATYDQPDGRECFEVVFDDGSVIVADKEHLWETHSRSYRVRVANDAWRTRQVRGTITQIEAVRREINSNELVLTTISDEVAFFSKFGIKRGAITHAASLIDKVCDIGSSGHAWRSSDVALVGLPVNKDSEFTTWKEIVAAGVSKSRARWQLAKINPVCGTPGSIFKRNGLLEKLIEILSVESYDQRDIASQPSVLTTAEIAASLMVEGGARSNHSIPVTGALNLPDVELPIAPYTLGAWLGDGTKACAHITTMDDEVLLSIEAEGYFTHLVPSSVVENNKSRTYKISKSHDARKNGIGSDLRILGVRGNKHIPVQYLRSSENQRRELLAGLLDTDGTCQKSGSVTFAVTDEQLARDTFELIVSLGYKTTLIPREVPEGRPGHQIAWTMNFTPSDKVFHLSRKLSRQVTGQRGVQNHRYITAVRPIESVPVRCITVDSPNHLYLAGQSMIPTHNTAQIEQWGAEWCYHVETIVGSNREATDFLGFPADRDGVTGYLTLAWAERLSKAEKGILFLDELTTSQPSVQKAMLRVLQERFVGEAKLPETVSIIAAANPPDVAVDGWELAGPVANRLIHIDWYFDADGWREGLVSGFEFTTAPDLLEMLSPQPRLVATRSMVAAFLSSRPDLIEPGPPSDPTVAGRGWPSPRSWTNFSTVAAHLREDDQDALMVAAIACVGEGAGREFIAWFMTSDLYDTNEVLNDPSIVDWTVRPDRIYALVLSLASVARMRGDSKTWTKAAAAMAACAKNGRPDLAYPGMRQLMQVKPDDVKISSAVTAAFSDLFVATGRWSSTDAA